MGDTGPPPCSAQTSVLLVVQPVRDYVRFMPLPSTLSTRQPSHTICTGTLNATCVAAQPQAFPDTGRSPSLSLSRFLLGLNTQTVAPPPGLLLNMTWALVVSQPLLSPLYTCGGHRCPWAPCIDMPSGSRAEPPRWRGPGPGLQGAFSGFDCPLASCLMGSPLEHPGGS